MAPAGFGQSCYQLASLEANGSDLSAFECDRQKVPLIAFKVWASPRWTCEICLMNM